VTQPDVRLDSAALRNHARMVDESAYMCDEAVAGAQYVDLHDEVYGLLCSSLALTFINPLQEWALRELRTGVDATSHLAELLRAVADDADVTDDTAARRFRGGE
jgi:Excreted virulence factor EspC, type VII ESX diderm